MHAFARTVLSDDASAVEINFARYSLDQRPRAGHNRGDLQGSFQEAFEKKTAHRECEEFTVAFRLSSNESGHSPPAPLAGMLRPGRKEGNQPVLPSGEPEILALLEKE